jgi:hypothetical protein
VSGQKIQINAWCDAPVSGELAPDWRGWALETLAPGPPGYLRPPAVPNYQDWTDPEVGWGLVVPDDADIPDAGKAAGVDLPGPLKSLLTLRHGVVLRYRPENALDYLRRYTADGRCYDVRLAAPERGVAEYRIPYYLLLYGSPADIPWEVQFHLNLSFAVGRLHLADTALERYVDSLERPVTADGKAAVIWAADHGPDDITSLLYEAVAKPIAASLRNDPDLSAGTSLLHGQGASRASRGRLITALEDHTPGLIVTTSHGALPLDPARFGSRLGLPVDDDHATIDLAELLASWQPHGAIWYAHACCSAGSDQGSSFSGLLAEGSAAAEAFALLESHASAIAPLATALLSAASPARAFIGHVEPTFDLTVRDGETGQALTTGLVDALYRNLYQPFPIGHCLRTWYTQTGVYLDRHASSITDFNLGRAGADDRALLSRIAAADHRSLVVLGDPAAMV